MPTNYEQAYDVLTTALMDALSGMGTTIDASFADPILRVTGIEKGEVPKTQFLRFTMNPLLERQSTLRNGMREQSYTTSGVFIVQVFVPRRLERAAEFTRKLATSVKLVYRANQLDGCVWARNVRINWLLPEENFLRANVVGEYEYEEIG